MRRCDANHTLQTFLTPMFFFKGKEWDHQSYLSLSDEKRVSNTPAKTPAILPELDIYLTPFPKQM